ncbi:MAG: cupin domain-containing protein [Verrucomicrobia bacterium]|nr:cupin domain-containing protein [Verrucomicrobiota bacterium]
MTPALLITLEAAKQDPALQTRGDRKVLVTDILPDSEQEAPAIVWRAPSPQAKCPVVTRRDTELAFFTERAKQTRHCHKIGTEIYTLLEGAMTIEVAGELYRLAPGDTLVVKPGTWHEVKRDSKFHCQVVTVNCAGIKDRHEH